MGMQGDDILFWLSLRSYAYCSPDSAESTLSNAIRLLHAFSPLSDELVVHSGAKKPLIRPARYVATPQFYN